MSLTSWFAVCSEYDIKLVFVQKFLFCSQESQQKLLPPNHFDFCFLTTIWNKSFVGWGFAPDPTGQAYSAPRPLAVFRGPTSTSIGRGRERRGGREFVHCPRKKKEKSAPMLRTCTKFIWWQIKSDFKWSSPYILQMIHEVSMKH